LLSSGKSTFELATLVTLFLYKGHLKQLVLVQHRLTVTQKVIFSSIPR